MTEDSSSSQQRPEAGIEPRLTPYEMVFAGEQFEASLFPRLREDAQLFGMSPVHADQFPQIPGVAEAVRDVLPPDAPADAVEQYRMLLYHAFNFWCYGKRVYLVEPAVARYLVEAAPAMVEWELDLPYRSLYIQLPARLFWASISPDTPPEPVDGMFLTCADVTDTPGRPFKRLSVLVVLGIRRDRAGFSVIPFDTEAGPGIARVWAETEGRAGGVDFENILPGGEIQGLYSILTAAEVLKLLARVIWYVDQHPEDAAQETAPERHGVDRPGDLPLPRIPYFRVSLGSASPEEG